MKYTVTLLLDLGIYKEFEIDVAIDPEESWEHFLSNTKVKRELMSYPDHKVIDIDPHCDFKEKTLAIQVPPEDASLEE